MTVKLCLARKEEKEKIRKNKRGEASLDIPALFDPSC